MRFLGFFLSLPSPYYTLSQGNGLRTRLQKIREKSLTPPRAKVDWEKNQGCLYTFDFWRKNFVEQTPNELRDGYKRSQLDEMGRNGQDNHYGPLRNLFISPDPKVPSAGDEPGSARLEARARRGF